jgi:hypothetical protein
MVKRLYLLVGTLVAQFYEVVLRINFEIALILILYFFIWLCFVESAIRFDLKMKLVFSVMMIFTHLTSIFTHLLRHFRRCKKCGSSTVQFSNDTAKGNEHTSPTISTASLVPLVLSGYSQAVKVILPTLTFRRLFPHTFVALIFNIVL